MGIFYSSSKCSSLLCVSLEPPSFMKKPDPLQVLSGENITFTSILKGTPPLDVKWFRGSVELVQGHRCNISLENSVAELELFDVQPLQSGDYTCLVTNEADQGQYTCHIENDSGQDNCHSAVSVLEPPYFVTRLEPVQVTVGDSASLQCQGSQPIRIQWLKAGREIKASDKCNFSFANGTALLELTTVIIEMHNLRVEDSGDYICEARNAAGSASTSTSLKVKGQNFCLCVFLSMISPLYLQLKSKNIIFSQIGE
uniref:Ig-like domain-containing protein n=1 Tax=Gopherus evgoodei TaxID=1825980 RepID=A0A8C4YL04_9SAUR